MQSLSDLQQDKQNIVIALTVKMTSLGFDARFVRVIEGPVVTQYFFKPLPTSPLAKIMSRTEDIALSVGAESVLIQRIKDEISISIPTIPRTVINFDTCLHWLCTHQYDKKQTSTEKMDLGLLMGQDTTGNNFSLDLARQPHILIAGSTGSGKSVFLSQLITSLVTQKSERELKFILVDTKQLDLTLFSTLPHVVECIDKIDKLHATMDQLLKIVRQRTEKMKGLARNIREYNTLCSNIGEKELPYYVVVIDELADVIGQDKELAKDESKDDKRTRIAVSLASLAQISRASGIHIIAATQRPSIQIISGDIKTNFPTRISFKLPTSVDSRVILDENGAECLLGRGDYLFKTAESSEVKRAHSAFVSMTDIATVLSQHEAIRKTFASIQV
jgi:S-DNA-T family DNA segregation ATPase FtsK/SpoIIIE